MLCKQVSKKNENFLWRVQLIDGFSADMTLLMCDIGSNCHVHSSLQSAVLLYVYTTVMLGYIDRIGCVEGLWVGCVEVNERY